MFYKSAVNLYFGPWSMFTDGGQQSKSELRAWYQEASISMYVCFMYVYTLNMFFLSLYIHTHIKNTHIYTYIQYIYICIHLCVYIYIYTHAHKSVPLYQAWAATTSRRAVDGHCEEEHCRVNADFPGCLMEKPLSFAECGFYSVKKQRP